MADQQQPQQQQEMNVVRVGGMDLPPGFHFHPSDAEIVRHYLTNKVHNKDFTCTNIGEVDLKQIEPWDLLDEAKSGEKEWYFFYQKDQKYQTGLRANWATNAGYWKPKGKDKEVYDTVEGVVLLVGMKKTLVFYKGRAPRGDKTNWVMHEYRLEGNGRLPDPASATSLAANATASASTSASKDEWVVCHVFDKTVGIKKTTALAYQVAMAGTEIDLNQNNIPAIPVPIPIPIPVPVPIPMPLQLLPAVPMPVQFPILPDFTMHPVAPYYPNVGVGMQPMMPPMEGIVVIDEIQINDAVFGNPMAAPPPMNFYHQMGMGVAAGQVDMEAVGAGGFDVAAAESRPSSMVSQQDEEANAAENSSMMSVTSPGSATTTKDMDGTWKYRH